MSHNQQLSHTLQTWLQAALSLLHDKPLPTYEDVEVTFNPNGYDATNVHAKPSYTALVEANKEELLNLPEVDILLGIVTNSSSLSSVSLMQGNNLIVDPAQQKQRLHSMYLKRFLTVYLYDTKTFEFLPAEFERLYDRLEHYIYTDEPIAALWLVQLRNFFLDRDHVPIDRGISLRKATYEEKKNAVKNQMPRFAGLPPGGNPSTPTDIPNVFLEIHDSITRTEHPYLLMQPYRLQEATQTAQALVLALRLLKDTPIGIASYYWHISDPLFQTMNFSRPTLSPTYSPYIEPYVLTGQDADILPKLWRKTKTAYRNRPLSINGYCC